MSRFNIVFNVCNDIWRESSKKISIIFQIFQNSITNNKKVHFFHWICFVILLQEIREEKKRKKRRREEKFLLLHTCASWNNFVLRSFYITIKCLDDYYIWFVHSNIIIVRRCRISICYRCLIELFFIDFHYMNMKFVFII